MQPATALWRVYEMEAVWSRAAFRGRVLDLGCGDGTLSRVIFSRFPEATLVGVDIDPADAEAARQLGIYANVHAAAGDAVPEPASSFDAIFSNSVLEHIPTIEPVLAEAARLLRVGGRFVFTVPSEQFHASLAPGGVERWLGRRRGEEPARMIDRRLQHHRYWSPAEWSDALGAVGFRVVEASRYFTAGAVQAWERMSTWTGGVAFELFGRRNETRSLQRKMKLPALTRVIPDPIAYLMLLALIGRSLREPVIDGGPSGGLFIAAEKLPTT